MQVTFKLPNPEWKQNKASISGSVSNTVVMSVPFPYYSYGLSPVFSPIHIVPNRCLLFYTVLHSVLFFETHKQIFQGLAESAIVFSVEVALSNVQIVAFADGEVLYCG